MIHCIGDSHSSVFSGREEIQPEWPNRSDDIIPYFKTYRIGPATAYQLENKITIIDQIVKDNVNINTDSILFCFGEVDIRAHLIKQKNISTKNIDDLVSECVERYLKVLMFYKNNKFDVMVWGVIASWGNLKIYTGPSFGTNIERNEVTKKFNSLLEKKCIENDLKFISIFDKMLNTDLTTKIEYLDDWDGCHIHLNQKSMPLILESFREKKYI